MSEIMLHPNRDFLNARNPSSPFTYKMAMCNSVWDAIINKAWVQYDTIGICINDTYYFADSNYELFEQIKHHWGL